MKVVLLDRDGTIIMDPADSRVDSIAKAQLFPDTLDALRYFAEHDFAVIIVTNQSGIAEGRITVADFWHINDDILERLKPSGVTILKTYMNGEGLEPTASQWRKPGPLMLLQAAKDFDFDISNVYMVGDNQTDIEAATNAGCKAGVLVKTGRHPVESDTAVYKATSLLDAASYIVANS